MEALKAEEVLLTAGDGGWGRMYSFDLRSAYLGDE
jgi:hypothetical protein